MAFSTLLSQVSILINGSFPEACMPTVFDNYGAKKKLDGQDFEVHFCPGVPIFLVGCKIDLRHDLRTIEELCKTNERPVPVE